jgi:hypothetical protein
MSKIIAIFELSDFTEKNYDDIVAELKATNSLPSENRPSHTAFQKGDKWCVIDVWNSEAAFLEFGQKTLFPIFGKLGLAPQPPQIFPVHHFVGANSEQFISA